MSKEDDIEPQVYTIQTRVGFDHQLLNQEAMGISGLYSELGPGERISLAKFASDHFEATSRRLRLAIDASIWSFQVQAGKGGTNPALRTLYYRLLRLYQLNITPLFVFDGRGRPAFKRNHKTNAHVTPALQKNTKSFLKLFGFPYHNAPGEAEAECAILQQQGVVDAVLSEDVDTIMFGCGTTFRNWSGEGKAGKATPTHVTVYDSESVRIESGLTPNGMILVALMSGGDYLPEGVPKCGIRTAVEAAKAGFGEELCNLEEDDEEGFREWRERLSFEIETNESGWFRRKNKVIKIPENFPDRMVLGYYTNPAVSSQEAVEKLRRKIVWDGKVDVFRLRESVRYAFEWKGKGGAAKFVRTLAPAILARKLADGDEKSELESIVKGFHGKREHFSTDGLKELRISFVPGEVIEIDMDAEGEDEVSEVEDDEDSDEEVTRRPKDYDIFAVERVWVQDIFARRSIREMIEEWETSKVSGKKVTKKAPTKTKVRPKEGTASGSVLGCLGVSKSSSQNIKEKSQAKSPEIRILEDMGTLTLNTSGESCEASEPEEIPAAHSHSRSVATRKYSRAKNVTEAPQPKRTAAGLKAKASKPPKKLVRCRREGKFEESDEGCSNSCEIPRRSSVTCNISPPYGHNFSTLGIYGEWLPGPPDYASRSTNSEHLLCDLEPSPQPPTYETIIIESSPVSAPDIGCPSTSFISPPTTPFQGRKPFPDLEASHQNTPTHDHDSHISQTLRAPSPTRSPNVELSPPRTLTAAFKRLQVTGHDSSESNVNRVLDFSPSAHLSPNITTKRKGRKVNTKGPQQEPEKAKEKKKKYTLTSPIPFPIPVARRPHPTSPLRRMYSASDTPGIASIPIEIIEYPQVGVANRVSETTTGHTGSKGTIERIRVEVASGKVDINTSTVVSAKTTQETQVETANGKVDTTTGTIISTKTTQEIRVEVANGKTGITGTITSTEMRKEEQGKVMSGKMTNRIVLIESLEGRWGFIEDDWGVPEGKKVWKDVEVLDLTADD